MDIDRFDVESALFEDPANKINRAELHVSIDGTNFVSEATNSTPHFWMTMPIENTSATIRPEPEIKWPSLQWASSPGHIYSIWHTDSLTNEFIEVTNGILGTGATLDVPAPSADLYDAAFYRLKANSED